MESDRACANCVYYDRATDNLGLCRVNPPVIGERQWPTVKATDWCGALRLSPEVALRVLTLGRPEDAGREKA